MATERIPQPLEPIRKFMQILSERWETAHRFWIAISGDCYEQFAGAHIDTRGIGMQDRQVLLPLSALGRHSLPSVSAGRTPKARNKANSQSRSPPMMTSSQNCTQPWTH